MGMSASQARLLTLTQRMSDIEYQGQQINQQRTTLSNQINALYNSLLEMDVPTPPSTNDYQKVVYSGNVGATKYNFEASDVIPKGNNTYQVKVGTEGYGNTISTTNGYSVVKNDSTKFKGKAVTTSPVNESEKITKKDKLTTAGTVNRIRLGVPSETMLEKVYNGRQKNIYVTTDGGYKLAEGVNGPDYVSKETYYVDANGNRVSKDTEGAKEKTEYKQIGNWYVSVNSDTEGGFDVGYEEEESTGGDVYITDLTNVYVCKDSSGEFEIANAKHFDKSGNKYILKSGYTYLKKDPEGTSEITLKGATGKSVDGGAVYTFDNLSLAGFDDGTIAGLKEAISNSNLQDNEGKAHSYEDFYVIVAEDGKIKFALIDDVDDSTNDNCITYDYQANGKYETKATYDDCTLTFDPSNGRITSIGIPIYKNGEIVSYNNIHLESKLVQDEEKYNDAMADYNYNKALYDKKQQEINKRTEIIQQQDKNLELKLTRLDNERNAVNTEIEAVKKVIQDNIDKSYKTFSG